ncbi:MFS transporter [Pseudomonas putida]|uniref:MFS transporter n=1 Tax=Pseudomonas putida TaxID=303 RepID=UPI00276BF817|nr:MFS transporter [Pseudomonas putida]MDP9520421.1 MFS transporter [Pseudomonas putida]
MKPSACAQPRRAATAAFIGTMIEWYDFYIYATAAALVFGVLFFPSDDSLFSTMAAFGTFAVGFFARPLGGIVFGHVGDRIGRKKSLVITLLMMGIVTVCIGLLPTYAQIGATAPVLLILLRIVQGIAVGGEWGGAVLMAGEHAPKGRRNFFASFAIFLAYQICGAIAGGLTPLIGTWLAHTFSGQWWPMAAFNTLIASLSLGCVLALARQYTHSQRLELA